ncbi:MAG: glycosyltransferase [Candidatus Margulisiibacteriota bacterium]
MKSMRKKFKDATVIFMVVHYEFECVRLSLLNILSIIESLHNTYLILINSNASEDISNYIQSIRSAKVDLVNLPINFGFNHSVNYYIKDFISDENLPKVVLRMDADILFSKADLEQLIDGIIHLKQYGTLALSYENNQCNPERNVLKERTVLGANKRSYQVRPTFFCPVAGGIMGIRGAVLKDDLKFEMFSPLKLPKQFLKVAAVGGADASLYNALKRKYKAGYIANTNALHMKTRSADIIDIPDHWNEFVAKIIDNESKIMEMNSHV